MATRRRRPRKPPPRGPGSGWLALALSAGAHGLLLLPVWLTPAAVERPAASQPAVDACVLVSAPGDDTDPGEPDEPGGAMVTLPDEPPPPAASVAAPPAPDSGPPGAAVTGPGGS